MKTLIASLAAVAAITAAAGPAAAQSYGSSPDFGRDRAERGYDGRGYDSRGYDGRGYDGRASDQWRSINDRQADLERRIERGLQRGDLTRREAVRLRAEFRQIARLEAGYRRDGLSRWERADLDRRFDRLAAQIRAERQDRDYGYNTRR